MVAQVEAESKELKFPTKKTKAMYEYAQVVIDAVDEHARTTSKRVKAIVAEQEEQSQSQGTILKAISKIIGQQRSKFDSRFTRQLSNELKRQFLMSSVGSTPRIFRKQVDLTALLDRLKVDISLPIGEKMELQKISMKNVLILLA